MFVKPLTSCVAACLLAGATVASADVQSLASIRATAERAVRETLDPALTGVALEAMALDARLRLPACQEKLGSFATAPRPNQARVPVRVTCASPAWTAHVPVDIRRSHAVLVLRRAVGRGEALRTADVAVQQRVLPGLGSPFVAAIEQLEGRLTRRPLPEGTALPADALTAALLIHRGETVTLVVETAGFEVRAPGRALADASAQQRVRVQNLQSLKIIEGVADTPGVVRVRP